MSILKTNKTEILHIIPQSILCVFAFLVGFGGQLSPISSGLLILAWIIDFSANGRNNTLDRKALGWIYVPMLIFLLLNITSLLYSDTETGLKFLEQRVLLLFIPIIGYFGFSQKNNLRLVSLIFVFGAMASIAYISSSVFIEYCRHSYVKVLVSDNFAEYLQEVIAAFQHRTYYGVTLSISLILLFDHVFSDTRISHVKFHILACLVVLFVLSTGGRAVSFTILLIEGVLLYRSLSVFYNARIIISIVGGLVILMVVFVKYYPRLSDLFSILGAVEETRFSLWKVSIGMIKEKWLLGYGIGDFETSLMERYAEVGMTKAAMYKLNPHNQFIQTVGEVGVFGLLALLVSMFGLIKSSIKEYRFIAMLTVAVFIFNFSFESMFMRIWGISIFTFVFIIFRQYRIPTIEKNIKNFRALNIFFIMVLVSSIFMSTMLILSKKKIDYNSGNPDTFSNSRYEKVYKLPMSNQIPNNIDAVGYRLNSTARTVSDNNRIHRTKIGNASVNECDSISFSVYCFVTSDFDGKEVFAGGYTTDYLSKCNYNLQNKGTWQFLSIRTKAHLKETYYFLQMASNENSRISQLNGSVIFLMPVFEKIGRK